MYALKQTTGATQMANFAELTSATTNESVFLNLENAFIMESTANGTQITFSQGIHTIVTQTPSEIFELFRSAAHIRTI